MLLLLPYLSTTGLSWTLVATTPWAADPLPLEAPVPQGAPHDLLPDTSDTDVGCPNLKDGDEVDADDLVLHLGQVDDVEDQVLPRLDFSTCGDPGCCEPPAVSGDMLLVALPCTSQMRTNSSRADLAPMFVPVVFVLMPSGSFDSFCYNLDVSRFQILWFPSSWLVLIFVTGWRYCPLP